MPSDVDPLIEPRSSAVPATGSGSSLRSRVASTERHQSSVSIDGTSIETAESDPAPDVYSANDHANSSVESSMPAGGAVAQTISLAEKADSGFRSRLLKLLGFAFTLVANMASFGCFAIQGVVLARMLGPADRGVFAAIVMFPQALTYLGLLGAPELFAGYAATTDANATLRRSAAMYGLFAGVVTSALCILLDLLFIPQDLRHILPWAVACALTMPLQQIRLSVQAVDHGQRNFRRYNAVRLFAASAFPALLIVGWSLGWTTVAQAATIYILAQFASFLLTQVGMDASWFGSLAISLPRALHQARGLMGAWFATELLERLDIVLMMVLVANEVVLGHYATAVPIAALMIIVPNAAGLYGFNRGARENERLSKRDAWNFIGLGIGVQIICALLLGAMLPLLAPLFYGEAFAPTVTFAWLLLPAGIFRGLLQAADSYMRARKKPGVGVKARLIGIPILLTISFAGRDLLGEAAIPIGLSIAQLVCFAIVARAVVIDSSHPDLRESN